MNPFKKHRRETQISRIDALQCKPVKNIQVSEERLETGEALLSYPVAPRPWIAGLARRLGVQPVSSRKKLQLDTLGTAVWDMIDGRRTVSQIIQVFAEKYRLYPREAEVSVTRFLRELGKRGLIGLR
jgi:hypothetical protein